MRCRLCLYFFKKIPAAVSTASHYNFYSTVMYNKTHHIQQNPIQYLKYDHLQQNSAKNTQSEQTSNIHIKPKKHIYNHQYHTTTSLYQSIQHRSRKSQKTSCMPLTRAVVVVVIVIVIVIVIVVVIVVA